MTMRRVAIGFVSLSCCLVLLGCSQKPKSFVRTSEAGWKIIILRDQYQRNYDMAFKKAADVLAQNYDLEVIAKDGGYMRTGWMYTHISMGEVVERYRTKITVKFSPERTQLRVRAEAQWMTDTGWVGGYDTALLDQIYNDLQGSLGRVVR